VDSIKPKSAIIFGGSGFIGTHLAENLKSQGYSVVIADLVEPFENSFQFFQCDVRKRIEIKMIQSPSVIFNLAAVHRTPGHAAEEYYETNVKGAENVTNWASENGVKKVIFTSSISVYGPNQELLDESCVTNPVSDYGKSKLLAEKIHLNWQASDSKNHSLVICRPAVIFGRGEQGNFTRLAKALRGRYFFYPGGRGTLKACGYVKDATRSLIFFAEKDLKNITYNFSFPKNYTIGEICDTFCRIVNFTKPISLPVAQIGVVLSKFRGPIGSLGERLLKLIFPTNIEASKLQEFGFTWSFDLESALRDWKKESMFDQEQ
jgi:nucleoside-diphosphate-sugar epimerase